MQVLPGCMAHLCVWGAHPWGPVRTRDPCVVCAPRHALLARVYASCFSESACTCTCTRAHKLPTPAVACAAVAPRTVALRMLVSLAQGETGDGLGLPTLVPGTWVLRVTSCPPAAIHSGFWPTLAPCGVRCHPWAPCLTSWVFGNAQSPSTAEASSQGLPAPLRRGAQFQGWLQSRKQWRQRQSSVCASAGNRAEDYHGGREVGR